MRLILPIDPDILQLSPQIPHSPSQKVHNATSIELAKHRFRKPLNSTPPSYNIHRPPNSGGSTSELHPPIFCLGAQKSLPQTSSVSGAYPKNSLTELNVPRSVSGPTTALFQQYVEMLVFVFSPTLAGDNCVAIGSRWSAPRAPHLTLHRLQNSSISPY